MFILTVLVTRRISSPFVIEREALHGYFWHFDPTPWAELDSRTRDAECDWRIFELLGGQCAVNILEVRRLQRKSNYDRKAA